MSKESSGLGKIISGWFNRIDRKQPKAAETESQEPEGTPEEVAAVAQEPVEPEYDRINVTEGALLEVWKRWSKDAEPPVLSLKWDGIPLPIDEHRLVREQHRLIMELERDARKYLDLVCVGDEAIGPAVAPNCKVYLAENRLVAWCFVFPPSNSEEKLTFDQIGKAMQNSGITTGIDSNAIVHLYQDQVYFQLIPIAYGTPAVQGENGKVIENYPREVAMEIKVDEHGVADYRSSTYVQLISKGDIICDIVPPEEGKLGICVDGTVLEPKPVHAEKIPNGRNTELSEDGLQLRASLDGHLQYSNHAFHVRPVLEVSGDVDYSTGNIDFNGDVHISGDVRENFKVRATGAVTIDGLVEAATIEAGGDLLIANGVLGNYKADLKSWGCVRVKYLENCVVYASKGVYADCIMSSQVFSDDFIQVTSGRGTVIGGTLTAAYEIQARLIGSQAGRKTTIKLGTMAFMEEDIRNNRIELENVRKEMQQLDVDLKALVEKQGMSRNNSELSKAQLRKSVLALKEMQLLKRQERLEPETPDLSRCSVAAGVIYPITQVTIGVDCLNVETITNNCKLKYNVQEGEIQIY